MSSTNRLIKNNYHTHTYLCKHATGTVEDYVVEAIKLGFDSLGMSDHAPWKDLIDQSVRMQMSDFKIYLKELKEAIIKYSKKIKIYKGVEIEYFHNNEKYYKALLEVLDYMTLGQHYIEMNGEFKSVFKIHSFEELTIYKNTVIEAIKTGYFKFVSHPDIFLFSQKELTPEILGLAEEIIITAKEYDIPLEINSKGIRRGRIKVNGKMRYRYPRREFWEMVKKHNARVIISSDAHKPELLFDEAVVHAVQFAKSLNIEVEEELKIDTKRLY